MPGKISEKSIAAESHILIFDDPVKLGEVTASLLLGHARSILLRKKHFDLVLSGGSSPKPLFRHLALECAHAIDWGKVRFFWADERDVPLDHPDSNFGMANELLLKPLGIHDENIFRIPTGGGGAGKGGAGKGDNDAIAAADAYEKTLKGVFGDYPDFDLVLLGLGEDGHTASLFPDAWENWASAARNGRWVAAPWIPHLNARRITLLPHVLRQGVKVWFLVSGAQKSAILRKVLDFDKRSGARYPAQLIQTRFGRALWLVDREAAAALGGSQAGGSRGRLEKPGELGGSQAA